MLTRHRAVGPPGFLEQPARGSQGCSLAGQQIGPVGRPGLVGPRKGSRSGAGTVWALLRGHLCPFSVCSSSCRRMAFSILQILHLRSVPGGLDTAEAKLASSAPLSSPECLALCCPHCGRTTQGSLAIIRWDMGHSANRTLDQRSHLQPSAHIQGAAPATRLHRTQRNGMAGAGTS